MPTPTRPMDTCPQEATPPLKGPAVHLSSSGLILARTLCGRIAVLEETGERIGERIGDQPVLRIVSVSDEALS